MVLPPYNLEVFLCGGVTFIVTVVMYRVVSFRCSLNLSPKVLGLPYVFLIIHKVPTLEPVDGPTFVFPDVLIPGGTQRFLMVLLPLKWVCMPYLLQIFLILLHRP